MKKTAVHLLIEELEEQKGRIPVEAYQKGLEYAIQAAKNKLETEWEQIEEAYDDGFRKFKSSEQAEARALELYPVVMWHRPTIGGRSSYEDKNEDKRQAFLKGVEFEKRNPSLIDFRNWLTENDNGHRSASLMVAEFMYQKSKP